MSAAAQLAKAEQYLARTMFLGIVGEDEDGCRDSARQKRIEFVNRYGTLSAVDHLYAEAARYEDM